MWDVIVDMDHGFVIICDQQKGLVDVEPLVLLNAYHILPLALVLEPLL